MHMDFFNALGKKVFGSSSSSSTPPRHQRRRSHAPEYDRYSTNIADVRGRVEAASKSDVKKLHSVVNSALWAIARTPALIHAIDQVEALSAENHLTSVLQALGDKRVLDDSAALVGAAERAETFLLTSRMLLYDSMEPMDAIRGIVGLCGDSQRVIENVMRTTYRKTRACTMGRCPFEVDEGLHFEESLMCTRETAQQTVDARANPASGTKLCTLCMEGTAAEKLVLELPPRACIVAVWKPLRTKTKGVQDNLIMRDRSFQEIPFKSSVVIANHQSKLVCMFREGHNYYRVMGHDLKKVSLVEWLRVKPLLAIFNRQSSGKTPQAGFSSSYVDRGVGRRGLRQESIDSSRGGVLWCSTRKVLPSEVIEVNDDEAGSNETTYGDIARRQSGSGATCDASTKERGLKRNQQQDAMYDSRRYETERGLGYAGQGNVKGERPINRFMQARENAGGKSGGFADIVDIDGGEVGAGEIVYATVEDPWVGIPRLAASHPFRPLRQGGSWGARCGEADDNGRRKKIRPKPSSPRTWRSFIGDARSHEDLSNDRKRCVEGSDDEVQVITGEACSSIGTGAAAFSNTMPAVGGTRGALNDVRTARSTFDRTCVSPGYHGDAIAESRVKISVKETSRRMKEASSVIASSSWQDHRNAISPSNIPVAHSIDSDSSSKFSMVEMSIEESPPSGMKITSTEQTFPPTMESPLPEQCLATKSNDTARVNGKCDELRERSSGYDDVTGGAGDRAASLLSRKKGGSVHREEVALSSFSGFSNATKKDTIEKVGMEENGEWVPLGGGGACVDVWRGSNTRSKRRKACGVVGVTIDGEKGRHAMEDLTGADEPEQGAARERIPNGLVSRRRGEKGEIEGTLTTIRGINLRQDHFERIVDSDGWLTSQIIDVRVKQLQEKFPQNLYYDSSFFGFLCPTIEKKGDFIVDYERVRGWTKRSRLPPGKSSIFEMRKLFIPVNQGNIHWVLVVVDMGGSVSAGDEARGSFKIHFFDSFGREGALYVQAVQQYLVSELSSRDKNRQSTYILEAQPPLNAPRQHNSSDCGVLMLHVMEELSTGPISKLSWLTQEEIISLRYKLVEKIRE